MKKIIVKAFTAIIACLMAVFSVSSCESSYVFDINDFSFTVSVEDGLVREGGEITYPELAILIEGPGSDLWNITAVSDDGEVITFLARTGMTEYVDLELDAFKEGKFVQNLIVSVRESIHQEYLGQETVVAKVGLLDE